MTNERAKSELEQLYMSLSEVKKKALDVAFKAMEQADNIPVMYYPQVDGITPTVVAQADGEKTCGTCKHDEAFGCPSFIYDRCENYSEWEQADKSKGKAMEQEPCEDTISRKSLKHKLQEQHDFFVNAYGGFSNLPLNDKLRVDEITNCIAMVVNEPSVKPQEKTGHWIWQTEDIYQCSECGEDIHVKEVMNEPQYAWCPICGCPMEIER